MCEIRRSNMILLKSVTHFWKSKNCSNQIHVNLVQQPSAGCICQLWKMPEWENVKEGIFVDLLSCVVQPPWVVTLHRTRAELADIALWWIAYGCCHRQHCHHRHRHYRHHNCYHWHALSDGLHRHHHHCCYHQCPCQYHQRHNRQCLGDGLGMGIINASDLSCHCSCHRHRHCLCHCHCHCYLFNEMMVSFPAQCHHHCYLAKKIKMQGLSNITPATRVAVAQYDSLWILTSIGNSDHQHQ